MYWANYRWIISTVESFDESSKYHLIIEIFVMLLTNDDNLPIKYEPERESEISSDKSKRLAERLCAFYVHHPKVAFGKFSFLCLTLSF